MKIGIYTGGMAYTNAYWVEGDEGILLIDAPQGILSQLEKADIAIKKLVLTHGHWDHIAEATPIHEAHQCPVYLHREDLLMCEKVEMQRLFGSPLEIRPVRPTDFLEEGDTFEFAPWRFKVLHVPGHCPGSICLYEESAKVVFAGDTLMQRSVGRADFPGGDEDLLFRKIREELLTLPDDVTVLPGHGSPTTIGDEKRGNPFFARS